MKKSLNLTFTLLLGAFVVLGLSACAEGGSGEGADVAAEDSAMTDTGTDMSENGPSNQMGGESSDVTVQGTINTLGQGLTSIPTNAAVQNINGWQSRLEGNDQLSSIYDGLGTLKEELQADQLDGQAIGDQLVTLGEETSQAAQNASGSQMTQLQTLGQTLTQAGNNLLGGEEGM